MEERKKDVLEWYRQKYGRQDVDDEACHRVQEELDRMECQDDRRQVEELQQSSHSTAHCSSCRCRLQYDSIAIETDNDDDIMHDNISS